jgi:hypothetical protein
MSDTNSLFNNDPHLKSVDRAKFNVAPSAHDIDATVAALQKNNHAVVVVDNEAEALAAVVKLIPAGKSVNTAGSTTLGEIGFTSALKTNAAGWINLKEAILAEKDPAKQADLRRQSSAPDWHLTSVTALGVDGTLYVCCATGTRTGPLIFGPSNVIVVVGVNKIVRDAAAAEERLLNFALPVEAARIRVAYQKPDLQTPAEFTGFKAEIRAANPFDPNKRITVVLVKKTLGF